MRSMKRVGIVLVGVGLLAGASVLDCVGDSPVTPPDGSVGEAGGACAARSVDDTTGVYVSINGTDSPTCGVRTAPCQTIQSGVDQAKLLGRSTVYIARGTYKETVTLAAGITLEGGWDTLSAQWVPICGSDEISAVKIQMPDSANTVVTASFTGAATLRLMSLLGKTTVAAGESIYGVRARDASITLESVVVTLGAAGAGTDGDAGAGGADGSTKCAQGDGGAGVAAGDGPGATAGSFTENGYQPSSGALGSSDGGTGSAGSCSTSTSCTTTCQPNVCTSGCVNPLGGCGGSPGSGGGGGSGGGSSIAVYGWNAKITLLGGSFTAGNGGNGGAGGAGGTGGAGGAGTAEQELCLSCINNGASCATVGDYTLATGIQGGVGGGGGHGGGGAGGYSYAVFNGGDAGTVALQNSPAFVHGTAGQGGPVNGASGQAADRGP